MQKDKAVLLARMEKKDALLAAIGGKLTDVEAKKLILRKLHDLANDELTRYLNAEKRRLIGVANNLWDKYSVSGRVMEEERLRTLKMMDGLPPSSGKL